MPSEVAICDVQCNHKGRGRRATDSVIPSRLRDLRHSVIRVRPPSDRWRLDDRIARCLVAGLGNPLMGDDGVGSAVVERLSAGVPLAGLRAVEVGPDVSRLHQFWEGEPVVWLVDAIDLDRPPGSIRRISHDWLLRLEAQNESAHGLAVTENLRWLLHGCPDLTAVRFTLWGVVPQYITPCPALSPTADRAVDQLVTQILHAWRGTIEGGLRG